MALIRIHNNFMWIDGTHMITKEVIREITSLWSTRLIPIQKSTKNKEIMLQTCTAINPIKNSTIQYATIVIGHMIYRDNLVSSTTIHVVVDMIENNGEYDLYELL